MNYFDYMDNPGFRTKFTEDGRHWWSINGVDWYPVPEPIYHEEEKS